MPAFFDTNVIRYLRTGLTTELPPEIQRRIVLSPVSAIEVLSQIAIAPIEALESIHRFRNWLPEQAMLLGWLEPYCARYVFGIEMEDAIWPIVSQMLDRALRAEDVTHPLTEGARELRRINEEAKLRKAQLFQGAAERLRRQRCCPEELDAQVRQAITQAIAVRVQAGPDLRTDIEIERSLAAYCEFHRVLTLRAVRNPQYRFDSRDHLNDHFDGEQLLYLADQENHFITTDTGYRGLRNTGQWPRIHILSAEDMQNEARAASILGDLIAQFSGVRGRSEIA